MCKEQTKNSDNHAINFIWKYVFQKKKLIGFSDSLDIVETYEDYLKSINSN